MTIALNGWRRLGILAATLWAFCVIGLAIFESVPNAEGFAQGFFVSQAIPAGTTFEGSKVILPNGKIVKIEAIDPASGRALDPWEIDWRKYPEIPKTTAVLWAKLAIAIFVVPTAVWLLLEMFIAAVRWVVRGFNRANS